MNETEIRELTESFLSYRNLLKPLLESLHAVSETYEAIRVDLNGLTRSLSGNASGQLEKIHSAIASQAKSGQELTKKMDEYASSGDRYARAVDDMVKRFSEVESKIERVNEIERTAETLISKLEDIVNEKRTSYNLKDLQKSLEAYNKNVERVAEFVNKDVADVLEQNARKIEEIRSGNEALSAVVKSQSESIASLITAFQETSSLLRKAVEGGSVNEQYLFEAFDRWAQERRVKIKK